MRSKYHEKKEEAYTGLILIFFSYKKYSISPEKWELFHHH